MYFEKIIYLNKKKTITIYTSGESKHAVLQQSKINFFLSIVQ